MIAIISFCIIISILLIGLVFRNNIISWIKKNKKKFVAIISAGAIIGSGGLIVFDDGDDPPPLPSVPDIDLWNEQTIIDGGAVGNQGCGVQSPNLRFPGATVADNGDVILIYCDDEDGQDGACFGWVNCTISSDNGATWGTPFNICYYDTHLDHTWSIITAPNGDILFLYAANQEWEGHDGTDIWRSTNNGVEGSWSISGNFSEFGRCFVYDWMVFDDTIYAFVNYPGIFQDCVAFIAYSTDNGNTWAKFGENMVAGGGEWTALPLNAAASEWNTIVRFTSTARFTAYPRVNRCGIPGHGLTYAPIDEQYETTDSGETWTELNTGRPESAGELSGNQHNKGNKLFWLDDEVIIATTEDDDVDAGCWWTDDTDLDNAWDARIDLGDEGAAAPRNAYTRFCALPRRTGDAAGFGGWGLLIWSEQCNNYIMGRYIANNATTTWTWPPGPIDDTDYQAKFTYDTLASAGTPVSFTDISTEQSTITGWSWDFGDGSTSSEQNPTHTFAYPDEYTVQLTTSWTGQSDSTKSRTVKVGFKVNTLATTDYIVWTGENQTLANVELDLLVDNDLFYYNDTTDNWENTDAEPITMFDILRTNEVIDYWIAPDPTYDYTTTRQLTLNEGANYTGWTSSTSKLLSVVGTNMGIGTPSFIAVWHDTWHLWIPGFSTIEVINLFDPVFVNIHSDDDPTTMNIP